MPRGYRLLIIASGGIAVLSALGTGAYFGALYATNDSQQAAKRDDSGSNTKQHYPNQIDRDRAGLPNIVERIASAPDPQSTDEKEKRDLAAQEASALWSFWMLVATGFSAIITMIGTGFLLWQIMLTREAVKDTGEATKAMREGNEMARDANRAWVTIEIEPTLVSISGKKCYVGCNLKFTNMGNGVAVKFSCTATLKAKSGDEGDFVPDEFIDIHVKNQMPEVPNSKVAIVPGDFYEINVVWTDIFDGEKIGGLKFLLTVSAFYKIAESDSVWRKSVRAFQITRKMRPDPRLKVTGLLPFKENEMLRAESLTFKVVTGLLAT